MANKRISELTEITSLGDNDEFVVETSAGNMKKIKAKNVNIGDYVTAGKKTDTELGDKATAEGYNTTASGVRSHTEGYGTVATGVNSHAEGWDTVASGSSSHASGRLTRATGNFQTVVGLNNVEDNKAYFIVGNGGLSESTRSNAFKVMNDGRAVLGADPIDLMDAVTKQYFDNNKDVSPKIVAYEVPSGGSYQIPANKYGLFLMFSDGMTVSYNTVQSDPTSVSKTENNQILIKAKSENGYTTWVQHIGIGGSSILSTKVDKKEVSIGSNVITVKNRSSYGLRIYHLDLQTTK